MIGTAPGTRAPKPTWGEIEAGSSSRSRDRLPVEAGIRVSLSRIPDISAKLVVPWAMSAGRTQTPRIPSRLTAGLHSFPHHLFKRPTHRLGILLQIVLQEHI